MDNLGPHLIITVITMLIAFVIPVLIIAGGVFLGMTLVRRNRIQSANTTPLEILKLRYAKGEITKEQFEEMTRDLLNADERRKS